MRRAHAWSFDAGLSLTAAGGRVAEQKLPLLREAIERAELVRRWLEDAARCHCPTLDDCPLFEDPEGLPERSLVVR